MLERFKKAIEDMGDAAKSIGHVVTSQVNPTPLTQEEIDLQNEWLASLPQNRLPKVVEARLSQTGQRKLPWISTQNPIELTLGQSHGLKPLGMVNGTCWYHFGYSWAEGHKAAWEIAIYRMIYEAQLIGAHAVVDIKLANQALGGTTSEMDYMVTGTALSLEKSPKPRIPVLTTVTAMEFVRLLEVNLVPVGLAIGASYEFAYNNFGFNNTGFGTIGSGSIYGSPGNINSGGMLRNGLSGGMLSGGMLSGGIASGGMYGSLFNQEVPQLSNLANKVRKESIYQLTQAAAQQKANYVLGHEEFFQLMPFDSQVGQNGVLARQITMGTVLEDMNKQHKEKKSLNIKPVLDISDNESLINTNL
jgi:uncharacterized protein YbjQ (UPF0145 family)